MKLFLTVLSGFHHRSPEASLSSRTSWKSVLPFHARIVTWTDSHKAPFNHLAEVSVPMRFMSSHTAVQSKSEQIRCEGLVQSATAMTPTPQHERTPELEQTVKSILPVVEIASSSIEGADRLRSRAERPYRPISSSQRESSQQMAHS